LYIFGVRFAFKWTRQFFCDIENGSLGARMTV
jgi:hypothetical protein